MSKLWSNDPSLDRYAPYGGVPPSVPNSPTSRAASVAIESSAATLRAKVLAFIEARGEEGATDEEFTLALGMNPSTARPRRRELELDNRIERAPFTRDTKSGRAAIVWRLPSGEVPVHG